MLTEKQLRRKMELAGDKVPSMLRRKQDHDYTERRMYMITMVTEGRRPYFGMVAGDPRQPFGSLNAPHTDLSKMGEAVRQCWYGIAVRQPKIGIIAFQMMPDHFHGILFVREKLEKPLGTILNGFKIGCNKAFRELCPVEYAAAKQRQTQRAANRQDRHCGLLFAPGYNDKILLHAGQLDTWKRYLADNPRRLLVKRCHPEFFRVQRHIEWRGMSFSAIGNLFLLRKPMLMQIQCSRSLTEEQTRRRTENAMAACRQGAILVSPSISPGEKHIMEAAFEKGFPEIILRDNGFAALTKPSGKYFDACANGQLLFLGPISHSNERKAITRSECLSLNDIAARLCQ